MIEISSVGLFYHPLFLKHLTGFNHPERPERLSSVLTLLEKEKVFSKVKLLEPEPASFSELTKVHSVNYLNYLKEATQKAGYLDADTVVSPDSFEAACLASGAVISAVDKILDGEIEKAFCLVRPPGHHALSERAMGFCLLNNLAIGAKHALEERKLRKIFIFDWDAHHGNGLQDIFYDDSSVLYISIHQSPLYPGTGNFNEIGEGGGKGFTINISVPPGSGDDFYLYIFKRIVVPIVNEFSPDLIMVAAGYDGHFADYLSQLNLTIKGYTEMTKEICVLASKNCDGRVLFSLEGGYNLEALSHAVLATLNVMASLGLKISEPFKETFITCVDEKKEKVLALVRKVQDRYWHI